MDLGLTGRRALITGAGRRDVVKQHRREVYDRVQSAIPLGRHGMLDEVASAVVFLAGPRAGSCVGTNLVCDGGMTSRAHH